MADHRRLLMERQLELNEEEAGNLLGEFLESSGVGSESDTQSEDGGPIDGEQSDKSVQQSDADQQRDEDRKSTRLNSSHVASSYAVFCLKKKTGSMRRSPARASAESGRSAVSADAHRRATVR